MLYEVITGEAYDKMPRVVPYLILPVGSALLLFRFIQASATAHPAKGAR